MDFKKILSNQLALDFSVTIDELISDKNIFTMDLLKPGRRIYEWDDALLKVCSVNNKIIMASKNEKLLNLLKQEFEYSNGGFIARYDNLIKIDNILKSFGHKICDCHHYYIPKYSVDIKKDIRIRIFEKDELNIFKGNPDFINALEFSEIRPDMLAVCSYDEDEISAMAAASRDSDTMWQIGINVKEKYRNKGLGAYVVNILKEEIIKRGILPFYGTVESHIGSQKIALNCGFSPAFWQLYSTKI